MSELLDEFYAVTRTSIYQVEAHGEYRSTAKKIVLKGASEFGVGTDLGHDHYYMIGIAKFLLSYIPEKYGPTHSMTGYERDFMGINTHWWGYQSSPIIGLFENEAEAQACFAADNAQPCDERWLESTKRVLERIIDHSSFFVTHDSGMGLLETRARGA